MSGRGKRKGKRRGEERRRAHGRGYLKSSGQTQICHDPLYCLPSASLISLLQPLSLVLSLSTCLSTSLILNPSPAEGAHVCADVFKYLCVLLVASLSSGLFQEEDAAPLHPLICRQHLSCLSGIISDTGIMQMKRNSYAMLTGLLWFSMRDKYSSNLHLIKQVRAQT